MEENIEVKPVAKKRNRNKVSAEEVATYSPPPAEVLELTAAGSVEEVVEVQLPAAGPTVPATVTYAGGRVIDVAALLRKVVWMLETPRSGVSDYEVNATVDDLKVVMSRI